MNAVSNTPSAGSEPGMIFPAQLAGLSIQQLSELPAEQLVQAHTDLDQLIAWTAPIRAKLDAAIALRTNVLVLRTADHNDQISTSETVFEGGGLHVRRCQSVEIRWDQTQLRGLARRIAEAGDQVEHFLNVQFSVDEARYQRWSASLQALVQKARIEELGPPQFTLSLIPLASDSATTVTMGGAA